eukprot:790933_1
MSFQPKMMYNNLMKEHNNLREHSATDTADTSSHTSYEYIVEKSCNHGDSFNIDEWIATTNKQDDKLSSKLLPKRNSAVKANKAFANLPIIARTAKKGNRSK